MARFNKGSGSYDKTRPELTGRALNLAASALRKDGAKSILEAGVGTARIAVPLQERGFDVVGLDLAAGMLSVAKAKGMAKLVRADATFPPFQEKTFDAVVLAHVLQLLESPARTFGALAKVAKEEIVVLLRKPTGRRGGAQEARVQFHLAFGVAAKELGISLCAGYGSWRDRYAKQDGFLTKFPPDKRITIQEANYSETLRDYVHVFEPDGFFTKSVSKPEFQRIIGRMKLNTDFDRAISYHRVDQMLIWHIGNASEMPLVRHHLGNSLPAEAK